MRRLLVLALAACGHSAAPAKSVASAPAPAAAKPALAAPSAVRDACADPQSELVIDGDVTTIDPDGVVRAIEGHRGELRRCFERFLKRDARSGSVIATFAVRDDGSVAQVQVQGLADSLDRCLCGVVAKVQFPPPHGTAIVSYPMRFSGAM
ncbi:MAG TPA: AgmX/PglI C-terminal domain-containing protein [Kofleriaceae bacterium]|nr:AgmX/PglI C-terminal domain-containing protein [Kofleriaceae bacterium]